MTRSDKPFRVVFEARPRELSVWWMDSEGNVVDDERFPLEKTQSDVECRRASVIAFSVLYQLVSNSVLDASDDDNGSG